MGCGIKKLPRTLDLEAQLECRVRSTYTRGFERNGINQRVETQCETVGKGDLVSVFIVVPWY